MCFPDLAVDRKFKFILIHFPSPQMPLVLIGVKECILKPRTFFLWSPHKEHSSTHWVCNSNEHLVPCIFKCWTNLYSISISQPLAHLQRRYTVEIPRVSLPDAGAKWDFRVRTHRGLGWSRELHSAPICDFSNYWCTRKKKETTILESYVHLEAASTES
jgi:hypothetical protein